MLKQPPRLTMLTLLAMLTLTSGCALSPQVVSLDPVIDTTAVAPRGAGRSLSINVLDKRPGVLVGYRGGVYNTAAITTSPDLVNSVFGSLERAFTGLGFDVAPPGDLAAIRLVVEITELSYTAEGSEFVRAVNTGAAVRVISTLGTLTVTNKFRDGKRKEVLKAPSPEENTQALNEELARVLGRVVTNLNLTGDQ